MSWRAITEADLLLKMSGGELAALRSASLGEGQADPLASQLSQLTDYVRGYIVAHAANTLGPAGTLPERIIPPAIDYLIGDVSGRVAGMFIDINGIRAKAYDNAIQLFRDIAKGSFVPDVPAVVSTEESPAPSPSMYHKHRNFSRHDQEGI